MQKENAISDSRFEYLANRVKGAARIRLHAQDRKRFPDLDGRVVITERHLGGGFWKISPKQMVTNVGPAFENGASFCRTGEKYEVTNMLDNRLVPLNRLEEGDERVVEALFSADVAEA